MSDSIGEFNQWGALTSRQENLAFTIKDREALYQAYIPFIREGGLFIPTYKSYRLGDKVLIELTLMDEPEVISVAGKVIWVTPQGAQGNRVAGVGVQFNKTSGNSVRDKIETYLAGMLQSEKSTQTV